MPDTITLDRQAVMDLLVEVNGVSDALAWLGGCHPAPLCDQLERKASRVADEVLGPWPENDDEGGPRVDLNDAGHERGRGLLREVLDGIFGREETAVSRRMAVPAPERRGAKRIAEAEEVEV